MYALAPLGEMPGQNWTNWRKCGYLPASSALTAIELVVDNTGLDVGARTEIVSDRLIDAVAASQPNRKREEHRRLARSLLDALLNEQGGCHDRVFRYLQPSDEPDGVTTTRSGAEKASRLSKGFAEEIRLLISTAERDVGNVDWGSRWNPLIERAYEHLREQLEVHRRRIEVIPQQTARSQSEAVQTSAAHILAQLDESHQGTRACFRK